MDSDYRINGFSLPHLLIIGIILGFAIFIFYWLWTYPCSSEEPRSVVAPLHSGYERVVPLQEVAPSYCCQREKQGQGVCVLYAMEIEPGTIVLQSQNGELFRVLQELDSVAISGSPTAGLPPGSVVPVHYLPSCTRPHMQTRPSAPPVYSQLGEDSATGSGYEEVSGTGLGHGGGASLAAGSRYGDSSAGNSGLRGGWRPLTIQSGSQY